ncbi:hypothetical protein PHMEG_00013178, partial [Phytophthora megakarya]
SNQQFANQRLVDAMKSCCTSTKLSDEAVVTLDFKMKRDHLYYQEKIVEHYANGEHLAWSICSLLGIL